MAILERLRDLDDRAGSNRPMNLKAACIIALVFSAVSLVLVWGDSPAASILMVASIAALGTALGRERALDKQRR